MIVAESQYPSLCCIDLFGCLDAGSAPEVLQLVLAKIEQGEHRLLLDLTRLDYASSAGLRVFLIASRRMNEVGGQITLAALNKNVRHLFDIAGLSLLFEIAPSRSQALQCLGIAPEDLDTTMPRPLHRIGELLRGTDGEDLGSSPDLPSLTQAYERIQAHPSGGANASQASGASAAEAIRKLASSRGPGLAK